jgi:hypothetical protein
MIARVFEPGGSFGRTCQYMAEDLKRAQVIWQEGVRGHDYRLAARDFDMVAALHDTISKPVFHGVLTFHRDENLDNVLKVGLALKYLDGVGMVNTQRLIAEHFDARQSHLHLVANRINFDGDPIHNFPGAVEKQGYGGAAGERIRSGAGGVERLAVNKFRWPGSVGYAKICGLSDHKRIAWTGEGSG